MRPSFSFHILCLAVAIIGSFKPQDSALEGRLLPHPPPLQRLCGARALTGRCGIGFNVRDKPVLVFLSGKFFYGVCFIVHKFLSL